MKNERYNSLAQKVEEYLESSFGQSTKSYKILSDAMRYAVLNGGKRLRGVLMLECARICGLDCDAVLPFAGALEMIHASTLVHDDLPCMDDDDFRRGKPSCHKQFGEDIALLAGDALYSYALQTAITECRENEYACDIGDIIEILVSVSGPDGVLGGQILDKLYEQKRCSKDELLELHALKTGALFSACARIPLRLSGADTEIQNALTLYMKYLGLAFQVKDDLLDLEGNFETLGKAVGADENKSTFVSVYGVSESKQYLAMLINKARNAVSNLPQNDLLLWICDFVELRNN